MKAEYLIDTSIWISYFREDGSRICDRIDELIDHNRVHINGIVLVELLTGARNEAEFDRLASALAGLKFVPSDPAAFKSAGRNGCELKRKGISVPLSDMIIATDCIDHGLILIEDDKHFDAISAHLALKRFANVKRHE